MPSIEGFRVENYRAMRDVTIGRTFSDQGADPLPKLLAIIGPNGSGKSTLMDAFGFLGDCLAEGVEEACEKPGRGGFNRLRTQGVQDPIRFEVSYRQNQNDEPIAYNLSLDLDESGRPRVVEEKLKQRTTKSGGGRPFEFLSIRGNTATAWAGNALSKENRKERRLLKLDDRRKLGIATLGNLSEHPRIVAFRAFLEGWYLSYFVPELARGLPVAGAQPHLNRRGDNLANYVQFMQNEQKAKFEHVLKQIGKKIPGVNRITTKRSDDGRLLLQFNDSGFKDPFYAPDMSDGTLKMFAYLLLLEDPDPAPLLGIEEPENGLHHQLLGPLANEMKRKARGERASQILVTTHSTHFVDALGPQEVFVLAKDDHGHSTVVRAADIPAVKAMAAEGLPLGALWYGNHFGRGNP